MIETNSSKTKKGYLTKKKIYEACIDKMIKDGFDNINISEICKTAEISVGGFYHHFKSKDEIIVEAYKEADKVFEEIIINQPPVGNAYDKIDYIMSIQMREANNMGVKLLTQLYKYQINNSKGFLFSKDRVLYKTVLDIIKEGQESNEITKEYDEEFITKSILRFSRGIMYDWCSQNGSYDIEKEMKVSLKIYMNGLKLDN